MEASVTVDYSSKKGWSQTIGKEVKFWTHFTDLLDEISIGKKQVTVVVKVLTDDEKSSGVIEWLSKNKTKTRNGIKYTFLKGTW